MDTTFSRRTLVASMPVLAAGLTSWPVDPERCRPEGHACRLTHR